jgi:tetratricopeptide (TPR) repeat protein
VTPRRDRRRAGASITLLAVLLGGFVFTVRDTAPSAPDAASAAAALQAPAQVPDEARRRFAQAVIMLHARHYEHAAIALHRVLQLAPRLPEAHVNMGFALLGLKRVAEARHFFDSATAIKPDQANAYYGLALSHEAQGDLALATGAMRSYLHLARGERPEHLRRARAALWEWEQARGGIEAVKR